MKHLTLTATILVCLLNPASGQNKTYFGIEFLAANDLFTITDNGDYLMPVPLINGQIGLQVRQEINRIIFIESGVILKHYWQGFAFKTIPYYSSSSSDPSWIIPLRFGLTLNLHKEKIFFIPVVGYSFGINPPFGYGLGYGTQTSNTTTIDYNYTENPDVSRYFSLVQTGVGLEFKLFKTLRLSTTANYYSGFNKITQLDIQYTVNNAGPVTGKAISHGTFWGIGAGLKYPISNFWASKESRKG
jgi:hypothetical protein